ncbi:hypothetical protein AMECASPLE_018537 [Ameca splendens]|uniref:Uncharacterized protein n=1 Tax=Ameca splendens TaxID=208324 RepID=A0ABV0YDU8_9TELE
MASFCTSLTPWIFPGRIFHTHLPDAELWNFPGWLLPDPDSPETIQPNLSILHLFADTLPALQALTRVTKKSSDLPLSPYSLLLQSESPLLLADCLRPPIVPAQHTDPFSLNKPFSNLYPFPLSMILHVGQSHT